ncbi:MAG: pyridoxamine 5'-phosphate oxidase family protein [Planctomycetota bacterium]
MAREFLRTLLTENVRKAQARYYGRAYPDLGAAGRPDELTADEIEFVHARDSFYMATVTEDGWPYVQHRGGPKGFLVAHSPSQLLFADYGGNRQLITVGSLAANPRVCLFLMDYAGRARLKILGSATVLDPREHADLVAASAPPGGHAAPVERLVRIEVKSFDWNCPKFITPRYTADEVAAVVEPLQQLVAEQKAELERR